MCNVNNLIMLSSSIVKEHYKRFIKYIYMCGEDCNYRLSIIDHSHENNSLQSLFLIPVDVGLV